jgi:hypothetical protein
VLQNWQKLSKKPPRKHLFLVADVFAEIITNFIITKKIWVGRGFSGCFSRRCASWCIHTGAFSNLKHRCLHFTESTGAVLKYWGTGAFINNNASVL